MNAVHDALAALIVNWEIPESRLWKHRAYVLENIGKYEEALDAYRHLDHLPVEHAQLKAEATTGLYLCNLRLGRVLESATILAEAAAVNPQLIARNTLLGVLGQYASRRDDEWLRSVVWPILHAVANHEGYMSYDSDQLHDVLDEFLILL